MGSETDRHKDKRERAIEAQAPARASNKTVAMRQDGSGALKAPLTTPFALGESSRQEQGETSVKFSEPSASRFAPLCEAETEQGRGRVRASVNSPSPRSVERRVAQGRRRG